MYPNESEHGPFGWQREMQWPDTGRSWVPTSPNLPRFEGVVVYPGQVLIEGTELSEGRGTTTPFEVVGDRVVDDYVENTDVFASQDLASEHELGMGEWEDDTNPGGSTSN